MSILKKIVKRGYNEEKTLLKDIWHKLLNETNLCILLKVYPPEEPCRFMRGVLTQAQRTQEKHELLLTKKGDNMPKAPAYKSMRWIRQDWRYIKLISQRSLFGDDPQIVGISYDVRCGGIGGRDEKNRPRLCLPREVIEKLWTDPKRKKKLTKREKEKNNALIEQVLNKLKSNKKKVTWNMTVKKAMNNFDKKDTFKNDPKKKRKTRVKK